MHKKSAPNSGLTQLRLLLSFVLCLCGMLLVVSAVDGARKQKRPPRPQPTGDAPTPASGTLSSGNPSLTYSDGPFVIANVTAQAGEPICTVPMSCSDFALTVSIAGGSDPTKQVRISVGWPIATADFDVYVYNGAPPVGTSIASGASSADPEVIILPAVSAVYTIRTIPFAPAGQSYTATVTLEDVTPAPPGGGAPPPRYLDYPAPPSAQGADSAGEPSIGVDWNPNVPSLKMGPNPPTAGTPPMNNINLNTGGVAFFTANLNEFRVNFDDCSSPAKNDWEDVTFATAGVTTLDPIGFVDHQLPTATGTESGTGLGRVFQDQLAGASSILVFSDNDGNSWLQSQGSGQPAGVDHQTVGGGPYNEMALPPPVHPLYPHQIYYASQDIGTAFAARSDNGGLTFNAGVPIWTIAQCGGLHGHVKVGPDGTVYVPNKNCGNEQGVSVSTDNGITWTIKTVPGSLAGDTDPSVGIGKDNTLYLGYQNGDGHPHIAVSQNHGDTWTDVDVSGGVIQNAVFPHVIAGDGDRASFGFLGTSTAGGYTGTNSFTGVWYFYIATTYDRGQTYTLVDATNGDPVQIGSICTGGTTCGGDRNLLDFNDLQLDSEGRPIAAFADGCIAPQCNASTASAHAPPYNESRTALATVIRQSGGPRLLSAYDSQANCSGTGNAIVCTPTAPGAPRVDQVARTGGVVHLEWSQPDNGGAPLTGYKIYRKTETSGTYAVIATVTLGCPSCKTEYDDPTAGDLTANYFYKVTATNSVGESASCDEFPVGDGGPQESACAVPGITILTDQAGDIITPIGVTTNPGWDLRSLSVAEPFGFAPDKLVVTLKVEDLTVVPPSTRWPVQFVINGSSTTGYWVGMSTSALDGSTGTPVFVYGTFDPTGGTGGVYGAPSAAAGTLDPASNYNTDGTITLVVPRSVIGNPSVGDNLTGFLVRVRADAVAIAFTPDNMPDSLAPSGSYTIAGNAACAPNALPVAALIGTPDGGTPGMVVGDPPLLVHFDASGSTDSDGTIATYHYDFGDGTSTDSSSPMIDHIYTRNGTFAARLTVTDNRGANSSNVAQEEVEVELPLDAVVSRKVHGTAGTFDIDLDPDTNGVYNVECRAEGSGYLIIYTFGSEYTTIGPAGSVTVSNGGAVTSDGPGPNYNQYQVTITGVTNAQSHNIDVSGLAVNNSNKPGVNGGNATLNNAVARLDLLQGDTTNDRAVNSADIGQTKAASGQVVGSGNFRNDDTADGNINSADIGLTKSKSGTALL